MRQRLLIAPALAGAVACAGCGDGPLGQEGGVQLAPAQAGVPAPSGERSLHKATLLPLGDSRGAGTAEMEVTGGYLRVRIHATGIVPSENIPQHIHLNPGCDPGGPVLVNLDARLSVPGEAPGVGAGYPVANRAGELHYEASRPLDDLRSALNTWGGAGLDDTAELLAFLDLEDRSVHMHVAFGPPYPAVTCGGIDRIH
ncbi:MAG TPA: hypothetical protein VFZ13_05000 [Gemmatimonadales bacterium]